MSPPSSPHGENQDGARHMRPERLAAFVACFFVALVFVPASNPSRSVVLQAEAEIQRLVTAGPGTLTISPGEFADSAKCKVDVPAVHPGRGGVCPALRSGDTRDARGSARRRTLLRGLERLQVPQELHEVHADPCRRDALRHGALQPRHAEDHPWRRRLRLDHDQAETQHELRLRQPVLSIRSGRP